MPHPERHLRIPFPSGKESTTRFAGAHGGTEEQGTGTRFDTATQDREVARIGRAEYGTPRFSRRCPMEKRGGMGGWTGCALLHSLSFPTGNVVRILWRIRVSHAGGFARLSSEPPSLRGESPSPYGTLVKPNRNKKEPGASRRAPL